MATKYNFNVPINLQNGVNHKTLEIEIKKQINSNFIISHYGDDLDIIFDNSLSSGDQIILNDIIANHDETRLVRREKFFSVNPIDYKTKSKIYQTLSFFCYGGSFHVGAIDYIDVVSSRQNDSITYDLRVVDNNTGNIICEKTGLNNSEYEIINLGTISNIPEESSILSVEGRVVGKSKNLLLSQVIIYYDNE